MNNLTDRPPKVCNKTYLPKAVEHPKSFEKPPPALTAKNNFVFRHLPESESL
jgi:hypothetical protein